MKNKLTRSQTLVINALTSEEAVTYEDIANITNLSYDGVRGRISELCKLGYNIERIRDGQRTFLIYTKNSTYRRPMDIKSKISQRIKTVDDFYKITDVLDEIKKKKKSNISRIKKQKIQKHPVLLLSDLHFGEIIYDSTGTLVYNTSVAKTRMSNLAIDVVDLLHDYNLNHITILGLGDMIDGDMIYRNHLFRVEKPAIEQIKDVVRALVDMIRYFNENGITVEMYNVRGNHGITNYQNLEEDNWDNVVYDMLEITFSRDKMVDIINFKGSEGLVHIGNRKIVITHGNLFQAQIKTSSGLRQFRGLCAKHGLTDGDIVTVGHLHEFGFESDQKKFLVRNGSLADASEYAFKLNLYSEPMQTLLLLDDLTSHPCIFPIEV